MTDELKPSQNEIQEMKETLAPHIVRQTLVKGRDRPFLVILTNFLHEFVIHGIPQEVIEPQRAQISSHEISVFPSDENGLKRGNTIQKRRFSSEEEALLAFNQILESIQKGDLR